VDTGNWDSRDNCGSFAEVNDHLVERVHLKFLIWESRNRSVTAPLTMNGATEEGDEL
jgi:hypothetical protein